jgi:carboxymethylenebutenolidase
MTLVAVALVATALAAAPRGGGSRGARAVSRLAPDTAFVQIGTGDTQTGMFVAWPTGQAAVPVVLVAHEWWGLDSQIRDVALRLAREGYAAMVPDLYHGKVADEPMRAHELARGMTPEDAQRDLDAAATWARGQDRTRTTRLAVMGFCLGGGVALQYSIHSSVSGTVMFYGAPDTSAADLAHLRAPLLGHFGEDDEGIPPRRVEQFRKALKDARRDAELYEYPGAGHAFMHEGLDSYRPDAERQAWARTLAFLQKTLKVQ